MKRETATKRLRAKLSEVKQELTRRRHEPIPQQGKWLRSVVQGYFNYHGVSGNMAALEAFRTETTRSWLRALRRRSQRHRMHVGTLPAARRSLDTSTQDPASVSERAVLRQTPEVRAVCGNSARTDLRGGTPARAFPTATPISTPSWFRAYGVAEFNWLAIEQTE